MHFILFFRCALLFALVAAVICVPTSLQSRAVDRRLFSKKGTTTKILSPFRLSEAASQKKLTKPALAKVTIAHEQCTASTKARGLKQCDVENKSKDKLGKVKGELRIFTKIQDSQHNWEDADDFIRAAGNAFFLEFTDSQHVVWVILQGEDVPKWPKTD